MGTNGGIRVVIFYMVIVIAVTIVMTACTGMKPFEPRNNREEGPEKGLFSGSQGEFVIFRKGSSAEVDRQDEDNDRVGDQSGSDNGL